MGDKIRGALFSILGDIVGLKVLDAFAGSGALSIEAVSRGASHVTTLDIDKDAIRTVLQNVEKLKIEDSITVMQTNAYGWGRRNSDVMFDVILLDPPYNDIRPDVIRQLAAHTRKGGVVVLSLPNVVKEDLLKKGYEPLTRKTYGEATLVFYRKIS